LMQCAWLPLLLSASASSFATPAPRMPAAASVSLRHRVLLADSPRSSGTVLASEAAADKPEPPPARIANLALRVLVPLVLAGGAAGVIVLLTALLAPLDGPVAGGVKLVFAGAVAGVISRTCCAPLEMVSTIMMCQGDQCGSMSDELKKAWRAEGLRGLFKGNGANCLKVAPSRGTQFLVYEFVKRQLAVSAATGVALSAGQRLVAGGIAGMVAALIVYPLEVIKTVLTVFPEECKATPGGAIGCVLKVGGPCGFYAGVVPTLIAMFPYVGVEFMVYETLKRRWEVWAGAPAGTLALLLLGAVGGACAQASAHPLDVIRRRLQLGKMTSGKAKPPSGTKTSSKPPYGNMFSGLYTVATTEGVHVLFRGLGPACLEKVPSTAIGYYIYEGMKTALQVASVR